MPLRRFAQRMVRLLYPYGSIRTVLRGPAKGQRFVVSPAMGLNYVLGTNAALERALTDLVRPGMTVFDIGANEGQMALAFSKLVGPHGQVVSVEPAPACVAALERNIRASSASDRVRVEAVALSDTPGTVTLLYDASIPTQNKVSSVEPSYVPSQTAQRVTVPALALDQLSARYGAPDVLKIDVEGAAGAVLRGATQTLATKRPVIYLELHGPDERAAVVECLFVRGYTARTTDGRVISAPVPVWARSLVCRVDG